MTIAIFDIDGTLADTGHRMHHIKPESGKKKNWGAFFANAKHDNVFEHVLMLNQLLFQCGAETYLITGRPDNLREDTLKWLKDKGVCFHRLYMRPSSVTKPDYEVKKDIFNEHLASRKDEILFVFEDRIPVAQMWRELGLPVLLCGDEWIPNKKE